MTAAKPQVVVSAESDLPEGWAWAELSKVIEYIPNTKPEATPNHAFSYVDISSICNKTFRITDTKRFKGKDAPSRARRPIKPGDVLFSNVRTYLRNVASVPEGIDAQLCSTGFTVLRSNGAIEPGLLFYHVLTDQFIDLVTPQQTGSQYPATSDRVVMSATIPIPPLAEQKRIVEKVEQLLARVNAARERLARVPAILKRFRQAVLAAACSGRLTADWREEYPQIESATDLVQNTMKARRAQWEAEYLAKLTSRGKKPSNGEWRAKYQEQVGPDEEPSEIPESWVWATVGQMYEVKYGLSEPLKKTVADCDLDLPVISMANITEFGNLNQSGLRYFPVPTKSRAGLLLRKGDLLFNWRNAPKWIGKTALFNLTGEYVNASFLLRLRPPCVEKDGQLTWLYLNHLRLDGFFDFKSRAAVNQSNFNGSETARLPIPVAPLEEQREIVRRVEALFKLADTIEKRVAAATTRAEKLTQAILAKAFRGELVPTEAELARREGRSYEPASALLARIQNSQTLKSQTSKLRRARP